MLFTSTLLALLPLALAAPSGPIDRRAPIIQPRGVQIVPGKYIVKLKDGASDAALTAAVAKLPKGKNPNFVYKGKFKGFASEIDDATLETIQALPEVSRPGIGQTWLGDGFVLTQNRSSILSRRVSSPSTPIPRRLVRPGASLASPARPPALPPTPATAAMVRVPART